MSPDIHVNWLAVVVSVVVSFAFGGLWYGPLFGKTWRRVMHMTETPPGSEIAMAFALNIVGLFLMAFVLTFDVQIWKPSTWGTAGADQSPAVYGFFAGFFVWLGYIVPMLLNGVAFERKPWAAFFIQAGYQLVSLQILGMILSYWR
jgi:hypothetical protein